jgi:hypothetical protein
LAYDFDIVAWEGWPRRGQTRGNRYGVKYDSDGIAQLPPANRVHGAKVVAVNPDNPSDTHQFWVFTLQRFGKWGQWYVFIGGIMVGNHGYELADDALPPGEDVEDE